MNRLARHQLAHCMLDHGLVFRVDVGGGLVQHHDGSVLQHGPGDGDALPLAAGEMGAARRPPRCHSPVRRASDEARHSRPALATATTSSIGGGRAAHADVFPHRSRQTGSCPGRQRPPDRPDLRRGGCSATSTSAQRDWRRLSASQKRGNELGDGGLARAGGPYKGGHASRRGMVRDTSWRTSLSAW